MPIDSKNTVPYEKMNCTPVGQARVRVCQRSRLQIMTKGQTGYLLAKQDAKDADEFAALDTDEQLGPRR